jgi:hypothetical protein
MKGVPPLVNIQPAQVVNIQPAPTLQISVNSQPTDPIAFRADEPGRQGRIADGGNALFAGERDYLVRSLGAKFVRRLGSSLSPEQFRALRVAVRDGRPVTAACPLYVVVAHKAMFGAIEEMQFNFDPRNKAHQRIWNDALEFSRPRLTAKESQTRRNRHLFYSRLSTRNRRAIQDAWRVFLNGESDAIEIGKAGLSAYAEIKFRPSYADARGKEFFIGTREFCYCPETLSITIPITIDKPLPGL